MVLLGPGMNGEETGGSIKELWLQTTMYDVPGLKFSFPLTRRGHPTSGSQMRIQILEMRMNQVCPVGWGRSPQSNEGHKTIRKLETNVSRAQSAMSRAKRSRRNFFIWTNLWVRFCEQQGRHSSVKNVCTRKTHYVRKEERGEQLSRSDVSLGR